MLLSEITEYRQTVLGSLAVLAIFLYIFLSLRNDVLRHIPSAGSGSRWKRVQEYHHKAKVIYAEAYRKVTIPLLLNSIRNTLI
jgi:hypothetical protein